MVVHVHAINSSELLVHLHEGWREGGRGGEGRREGGVGVRRSEIAVVVHVHAVNSSEVARRFP